VINTILILLVLTCLVVTSWFGYNKFKSLDETKIKNSEIAQIVADEGFKRCAYLDSLGKATIGFGHLLTKDDKLYKQFHNEQCITAVQAVELLRIDYNYAEEAVEDNYPWAKDDVKLVLTNMTYQLGVTGVSKFKLSIALLKAKNYDEAAGELLNSKWAAQTPSRAARLAGRIMALN